MSDLGAKSQITFEFGAELVGSDGYRARFRCDSSFRSWLAISRWNLHYHHWRALAGNIRDLCSKVAWGKLWRRSS